MKLAYRLLSLVLALCMIFSVIPFGVLAEGEEPVCASPEVCVDGHVSGCPLYAEPAITNEEPVCTYDADCTSQTHEAGCPGSCTGGASCANGHISGCPLHVACTGGENCPGTVHTAPCAKACQQYDGCVEGTHSSDCCLFVCPECGVMGGTHADRCATRCTRQDGCTGNAHGEGCPLYLCDTCGKNVCECETPKPEQQQKALISIAVTTAPDKVNYTVGEDLDVTGGKLTLTYSDESTQILDITAEMVSGFDSSAAVESQTLTVTYEDKTADFVITIAQAPAAGAREILCSKSEESHIYAVDRFDVHFHEITLELLQTAYLKFYFYDSNTGESTPLGLNELSSGSNDVTLRVNSEHEIEVCSYALGTANLRYSSNGISYTIETDTIIPLIYAFRAPVRTEKNFARTYFPGENKLFLVWDSHENNRHLIPETVTAMAGDTEVTLAVQKKGTYYTITFTAPENGAPIKFSLKDGEGALLRTFSLTQTNVGDQNQEAIELMDGNQLVAVNMGTIFGVSGTEYIDLMESHVRLSVNPNVPDPSSYLSICFAALNVNGTSVDSASSAFYSSVSNIRFEIASCVNTDGTPSETPNLVFEGTTSPSTAGENATIGKVTTKAAMLYAPGAGLFDAVIKMHFTYDGENYTIQKRVWREDDSFTVHVENPEDLHMMLASNEAFFGWLESNYPAKYQAFLNSTNNNTFIDLRLAAGDYGDVVSNLSYNGQGNLFNVRIWGSQTNGGSIMTSLRTNGQIFYISNINFAGENATGPAIAPLEEERWARIPGGIGGCSFRNYTIAIYDVGMGFADDISDCVFDNCETAILLGTANTGSSENFFGASYYYNVFFKCGTAIKIQALPPELSPYYLRINRNIFLFNAHDFDVAPSGTFYFQQNFYGHNEKETGKSVGYWMGVSDQTANIIRTNVVRKTGSGTKLITNPVLKHISDCWEDLPGMWVDNGNGETRIFASEAEWMYIDKETFNQTESTGVTPAQQPIVVSILNDDEGEIAQWTFNTPEEGGNAQ